MYNFVDTIESPGAIPLPAEAMSYGGVFIEHEIDGYRTLYVEGRETISASIEATETQIRHGASFRRMRYEPRTLIIGFQLVCNTAAGMMSAYNKLLHILSKKQAQIIFNDEPDKFFTGTKTRITNTPPGKLAVTGEIEIFCSDPFKYSVQEYEATDVNGVITVDYGGTYPAHPVFTAVSEGHDNGFYSFVNNDGYVVQVGDPSETDTEEEYSEENAVVVKDYRFGSSRESADYNNDNNYWKRSQAKRPYYLYYQTRDVNLASTYMWPEVPDFSILPKSGFYGPSLGHDFTEEEGNHKNFKVNILHRFHMDSKQGGFDFTVVDSEGHALCGFALRRFDSNIEWYMRGPEGNIKQGSYSEANNPFSDWNDHSIVKIGDTLTFTIGPNVRTVRIPGIENIEASNLTFSFYWQVDNSYFPSTEGNALNWVTFRAIPGVWIEVLNKIPTGGLVEVSTESADITVNGAPAAYLGSVDNDFESFVLDYGENTVTCHASNWVDDAVYTMKYREVFL